MKDKRPLCCEVCNYMLYYCHNFIVILFSFSKQLTNSITYSFRMAIISSVRLKTYSTRSVHFDEYFAIFPQRIQQNVNKR